ncbi:ABC transporter permease [Ureaplasma canigenitalium]|uniref:ABC transporter permease n=1 Tax=Ureaplasma canigenitalium TaxID=42092 RepID=UPI0004E0D163|nr:ABC transporter permease [Ureaplasma canigenitalium]
MKSNEFTNTGTINYSSSTSISAKEIYQNLNIDLKKHPHQKEYRKSFKTKLGLNKGIVLCLPYFFLTLFLLIVPLIIIVVKSFTPSNSVKDGITSTNDNFEIIRGVVIEKIGHSFWISLVTTFICIILAYPFTYFVSISKNKLVKTIVIALITAPIWMSLLVKLIGIKTFFDVVNGEINSTYGHIFTIMGLTYVYLPFMMLPIYNTLTVMPRNIINASYDLGRGHIYTFFRIVVPYTKNALLSGISLVFLSTFTSVAVAGFLNNSNDGTLIGEILFNLGQGGASSSIQLSRASAITLIIGVILIAVYILVTVIPKIVKKVYQKITMGRKVKNEKTELS